MVRRPNTIRPLGLRLSSGPTLAVEIRQSTLPTVHTVPDFPRVLWLVRSSSASSLTTFIASFPTMLMPRCLRATWLYGAARPNMMSPPATCNKLWAESRRGLRIGRWLSTLTRARIFSSTWTRMRPRLGLYLSSMEMNSILIHAPLSLESCLIACFISPNKGHPHQDGEQAEHSAPSY